MAKNKTGKRKKGKTKPVTTLPAPVDLGICPSCGCSDGCHYSHC